MGLSKGRPRRSRCLGDVWGQDKWHERSTEWLLEKSTFFTQTGSSNHLTYPCQPCPLLRDTVRVTKNVDGFCDWMSSFALSSGSWSFFPWTTHLRNDKTATHIYLLQCQCQWLCVARRRERRRWAGVDIEPGNQASQTAAWPVDWWPGAITKLGRRKGENGVWMSQFQRKNQMDFSCNFWKTAQKETFSHKNRQLSLWPVLYTPREPFPMHEWAKLRAVVVIKKNLVAYYFAFSSLPLLPLP